MSHLVREGLLHKVSISEDEGGGTVSGRTAEERLAEGESAMAQEEDTTEE